MSWSSEYIESTVKIYLHTDYHSGFGGARTHASALITFNFESLNFNNFNLIEIQR